MKTRVTKEIAIRIFLSLSLAFLLWVFAITNTDPMVTQSYRGIQITFQNLDALNNKGFLIESITKTVDVQLYGRTIQISKISSEDISAVVDLSNISDTGTYSVEVTIKGIGDNISVASVSPQYITIDINEIVEIETEISIDFTGELKTGYAIIDYSPDIDSVVVSGSEVAIEKIDQIKGIVDITDKDSSFVSAVDLKAYDTEGNEIAGIEIETPEINVSVEIAMSQVVDILPITYGTCTEGYYVQNIASDPTSTTIAGSDNILRDITEIETEAIDISDKNTTFTVRADLSPPNGVSIIETSSASITVTIAPLEEETFTFDTIQVRNVPSGLESDLSAFTGVTMTVQGDNETLSALTKDDIDLYIDLSGLSAGEHIVEILYEEPEDITVKSLTQTTVSVILTDKLGQ